MNKFKLFFRFSIIAIIMSFALILAGCAKDKPTTPEGKPPREIVEAAYAAMQGVKSYAYTMEMSMSMPNQLTGHPETTTMQGSGQAGTVPPKTHLTVKINTGQLEIPMELYALAEDNNIVEYISNPAVAEGWLKMELPLNEEAAQMLNPAKALEIMKQSLADAKILGEEEQDQTKLTVLEVKIDPKAAGNIMQMFSGSGIPVEELEGLFASMESFSYKMWVRQDNYYTTKFEMDLEQLFKSIAAKETNEITKKTLNNTTAVIKVTYTDFDKPVNIEVPDEVKKSAKDISEFSAQTTHKP